MTLPPMFSAEKADGSVPIFLFTPAELSNWLNDQPKPMSAWCARLGFDAKSGQTCLLPDQTGKPTAVLVGKDKGVEARWTLARVAKSLKLGAYHLASDGLDQTLLNGLVLSWSLGNHTYKEDQKSDAKLFLDDAVDQDYVVAADKAIRLVRTLISTPTNLMGPADLAHAAKTLAHSAGGTFDCIVGDDLLTKNFPAIHAVGRAAAEEQSPRLIDFSWGKTGPKITLVGKGVCFDTGGLDLKSAGNMRLMKKDMGGSAHVLGLASLIVDLNLPVQLRVLIPAVENSVAGNAFRPGDVIDTRQGLSVEVGNTDAEGRLVLADALTYACEASPVLLIDFATLTGAARIALGFDLPAVFCNDDKFAAYIQQSSDKMLDPTWRLPLHDAYRGSLSSHFADTNNIPDGMPQAGAITAALFLEKFVAEGTPWAHLDIMAYNTRTRPGRPVGGEVMGLLAMFEALKLQLKLTDAT